MRRVEIVQRAGGAHRDRLVRFVDELTAELGSRPLSDHLWLDLRAGGSDGFVAVTADELDDDDDGSGDDARRILGLAQVSAAHDGRILEVAVRPGDDADAIGIDLADTAIDAAARHGGGRITWWVDDAGVSVEALATAAGLAPERRLHEMRRPLPHPDRSTVATRAFVPGVDDDAWLAVNNRAFAAHGEQGGWTSDTLALRLAEPWFDPAGFRLHHDADGRLVAFCWTKVHGAAGGAEAGTAPLGEIYVIAVDPDAHGRGLGRELTLAGLDWLSDHGIRDASLYVDAGNTAAVRMYERLGFHVHRTRTAFAGTLGGS